MNKHYLERVHFSFDSPMGLLENILNLIVLCCALFDFIQLLKTNCLLSMNLYVK